MSGQYDNNNRGSIWKNERKTKDTHPDFTGSINVEGRDYFFDAWKRKPDAGPKAPALTFRVKPKDAVPEGHPERFVAAVEANFGPGGTVSRRERPSGFPERPRAAREDDLDDGVPF